MQVVPSCGSQLKCACLCLVLRVPTLLDIDRLATDTYQLEVARKIVADAAADGRGGATARVATGMRQPPASSTTASNACHATLPAVPQIGNAAHGALVATTGNATLSGSGGENSSADDAVIAEVISTEIMVAPPSVWKAAWPAAAAALSPLQQARAKVLRRKNLSCLYARRVGAIL
jgi:hypothetical protein